MRTRPPASEAASPHSPVYPFNEPGQPIVLYEGPVGGPATNDAPGVVELSCVPELNVAWRVEGGSVTEIPDDRAVTLLLRRRSGDAQVPGIAREANDGWSNGAVVGTADAPLKRIVAHWFNLPNFHGPIALTATAEAGGHWWLGRWETEVDGWKVTVDVRPDHDRVWRDLHRAHVYVMTHVTEVRRADGATFTAAEAEPLLAALHVGVSFALGRWAAPMLPVGEASTGEVGVAPI